MAQFEYTIKDPLGVHARPAGMIAKLAKNYPDTDITISCNGKEAKAIALMRIMSLGIKQGHTVTVTAEGVAEDVAIAEMLKLFQSDM